MTEGWLDLAVRRGLWPALGEIRGWNRYADQAAVEEAVRAVLPPVAGTVAEYADQLRSLANATAA